MTEEKMNFRLAVEKPRRRYSTRHDRLRRQQLIKLEVGAKTGAGPGERSPDRLAQRNGYT